MNKKIKMNLDKYQYLAFKTCKNLKSEKYNLLHMIIGIHSEYSELYDAINKSDRVNVGEEVADHFWYIAGLCTFKGWALEELVKFKQSNDLSLAVATSILQDVMKKEVVYNKKIDDNDLFSIVAKISDCLLNILEDWELDLSYVLDRNIAKLKIRYPNKYTDDKAINRDLIKERKELEK